MRRIFLILLCIISFLSDIHASDKKEILDSIASSIVKNRAINLFETCINVRSQYNKYNEFAIEAALYKTQKETLKRTLEDVYGSNTTEELNELLSFVNSNVYKCVTSYDVTKEYIASLVASATVNVYMRNLKSSFMNISYAPGLYTDIVNSMFAGTFIDRRDFKIKDKEYVQIYNSYHERLNKKAIENEISLCIDNLFEKMHLDISRSDILHESTYLYSTIKRNTLYRYITKEDLSYLAEFYNTNIGKKFTDIRIDDVLNLYSSKRFRTNKTEVEFKNYLENITDEDYFTYLAIRKEMSFTSLEPLKNIQTIKYKKGTYTGSTFNGEPEGDGVYIDKKGIKYTGNFTAGKMHGCMTVHKQNGDSLREMWANGKRMKEQSIEKPTHGVVKLPPTYTNDSDIKEYMGYGCKTDNGIVEIGMFVDGVLHGEGERYRGDYNYFGIFYNDNLVKGDIIYNDDNKQSQFRGTIKQISACNATYNLRNGAYKEIQVNDSIIKSYIGTDISGLYNGIGETQYHNKNKKYSYKRKGYFAYDRLYGEGVEVFESDGSYKTTYIGEFINTKKNGRGSLLIECKNTFNGFFTTHYQDMHFKTSEDMMLAKLEGIFKNDKFIEGKITISSGDSLDGKFNNGKLVEGYCCVGNNSTTMVNISLNASYEGEIKNGVPHGKGKYLTVHGDTHEGVFENGRLIKGIIKNRKGKIISKK